MTNQDRIIETDVAQLQLDQQGFLRITLMDTTKEFDAAEAKRQIAAAHELTNGERMRILVDTTQSAVSPTREAKSILADVEHKIKEAVIVSTLGHRILMRIYFKLINQKYPVQVFGEEQEAISWLMAD